MMDLPSVLAMSNFPKAQNSHCRQTRNYEQPRTREDGLKVIDLILAKDLLCWHDVNDINLIYQSMDTSEKQLGIHAKVNSNKAFSSIFAKAKVIANKDKKNYKDIISLYHLQNFTEKGWGLDNFFAKMQNQLTEGDKEEIAAHLPCCVSVDQLNNDVSALIGPILSEAAERSIASKRAELRHAEDRRQKIEAAKDELALLQLQDPDKYPSYLNELLENDYYHLYVHLMEMRTLPSRNDRLAAIKKMTFSSLSHVILETRRAIIQKVKESLSDRSQFNGITFLLGGTGKGKSTALCFLRGDEMVLNQNSQYDSKSDKKKIIGHSSFSCTFLPTIEIVNGQVFVDFLGLGDTNGPLVSMGMEFAFQALVKKYRPKILILEAVVSEDRGEATGLLTSQLNRLLSNRKDSCILGFTKYSCNADFRELRLIENQQRNELFGKPSDEEIALASKIELYGELARDNPAFLLTKQELENQLSVKRQARLNRSHQPLPETNQKKHIRQKIEQKEADIIRETGLQHFIRFCDLERGNSLDTLAALSAIPAVAACLKNEHLDSTDKELLNERFENDLRNKLEFAEDSDYEFRDLETFRQSIETFSLVQTITQSSPEIGQFLHLPEMDSSIVKGYDKKIVSVCITKYMESVIGGLNITDILEGAKAWESLNEGKILIQKSTMLRNYIMGLLGLGHLLVDRPQQAVQTFKAYEIKQRELYNAANQSVEERFKLSKWVLVALAIPFGIPYGILQLIKNVEKDKARANAMAEHLTKCSEEIDRVYETLVGLKEIEKIIHTKDRINKILKSVRIPLNSNAATKQALRTVIEQISVVYGPADWEARVLWLADKWQQVDRRGVGSPLRLAAHLINQGDIPELSDLNSMGWDLKSPLLRAQLAAALLRLHKISLM